LVEFSKQQDKINYFKAEQFNLELNNLAAELKNVKHKA